MKTYHHKGEDQIATITERTIEPFTLPAPPDHLDEARFHKTLAAIPLADVQHSIDDATRYLAEMNRQGKLGQWLAYLFESIEESIGVVALYDARAVLRTRFNNTRW